MTESLAKTPVLPPPGAQAAARHIARVAVFNQMSAALADWAKLEAIAPASIYQTRRWLAPWISTIGAARGIQLMLVVGYDEADQPAVLLPLGTERAGPIRAAKFLGGKDSNFNMGLIAPGVSLDAAQLRRLLAQAASLAQPRPDLFLLSNQAVSWEGIPNPFQALPHQPSPSFGYKAALSGDPETFLKSRLSGDARKKLNAKLRKLGALGEVAFRTPSEISQPEEIIAAYQLQKAARFKALGIADPHDAVSELQFLRLAAQPEIQGGLRAMEWYALVCGGKIVAEFAGGSHRGRLHGMVTSFDMSPEFAVASPGDLLMQRLFGEACRQGISTLDLGIGEARYKASYCDAAEPLFDVIVPASLKGRVYARLELWRLALKRRVKQSPRLWRLVLRLRKWRAV